MEIGIVAALLLGLALVNAPFQKRPRTLVMILAATGCAGLAAAAAGYFLSGSAAFQTAMDGLFGEIASTLQLVFSAGGDAVASSQLAGLLDPSRLRAFSEAYLLRSMLLDYAVLLSFSWWAGQASAMRVPVLLGAPRRFQLSRFRLESFWLWPLIGSAALVALALAFSGFGSSVWSALAWNAALVMLFLYGLQGMAILWFLFDKHRIPRFLWFFLVAGLAILAASPGAGVFFILAVPVLGISENWIRLRIPRGAAPSEEE